MIITTEYASIGHKVQITCPGKNVNTWRKSGVNAILAYCKNGIQHIDNRTSHKISKGHNCNELIFNNFTMDDVGIYVCITNKTEMGNFKKHGVEVKLNSKYPISKTINGNCIHFYR